jgi:hypothetical protein
VLGFGQQRFQFTFGANRLDAEIEQCFSTSSMLTTSG